MSKLTIRYNKIKNDPPDRETKVRLGFYNLPARRKTLLVIRGFYLAIKDQILYTEPPPSLGSGFCQANLTGAKAIAKAGIKGKVRNAPEQEVYII